MKVKKGAVQDDGTQADSPTQGPLYHVPVLFDETIEGLDIKPNGIYVDCTFGGGGHSRGILEKLGKDGKLVAFDQDEDAVSNLPADKRVVFVPQNFKHMHRFLRLHKIKQVDGVLADLGVSSHQFDEGDRGFSIRFDGPLDMRMDKRQLLDAAQIIATYTEQQLHKLFEQYGEVSNSKTLAKHIVSARQQTQAQTILQFKAMISPVVKGNPNKYLAQVFQALRIEVNEEMDALKEMLLQLNEVVKPGGRVAIITFHSLEDRLAKQFFKNGSFDESEDDNPFVQNNKEQKWALVNKKPITATEGELKLNKRSRSAKLRVAERLF
ncbi:16S rRNA (cytosine(1402)-N(4))-methyltransferase RsmH [Parasediminibacterium sp. JCM 36343]|uniref:16S rRNA (cytosine(1402)-N(4))-methyltransferase RsmH n=1 Tax=Parasediminibacterium sp. JCM 36343 TaxID=3374279 RepID=UPI0039789D97